MKFIFFFLALGRQNTHNIIKHNPLTLFIMTAPLIIANNITPAQAKVAINRLEQGTTYFAPSITNGKGCLLGQKALHQGETGYIKMKVNGRTEYYAHHIALVAVGRGDELMLLTSGHQVSHLCGESRCFNHQHLVVETAEANRARNMCISLKYVRCPCPCNHVFNPCPHFPQCILEVTVWKNNKKISTWWCPSVNSFKFQPCDHTPPRTQTLWFLQRCQERHAN